MLHMEKIRYNQPGEQSENLAVKNSKATGSFFEMICDRKADCPQYKSEQCRPDRLFSPRFVVEYAQSSNSDSSNDSQSSSSSSDESVKSEH